MNRCKFIALIADAVRGPLALGSSGWISNVHGWSAYPPILPVNADITLRRPCANSRPMQVISMGTTEQADQRHDRLLCAHCERQCSRHAAEEANELASPHIRTQALRGQHCIGSNEHFGRAQTGQQLPQCTANVADGSIATIAQCPGYFCYPPKSGAIADMAALTLRAMSRPSAGLRQHHSILRDLLRIC
jgi:hypothetical protein